MTILLFGVSCVGKTTIGAILAQHLAYSFYDLDDQIKPFYHTTLEAFVSKGTLSERDQKRGEVISHLLSLPGPKVIAVSPMSNRRFFGKFVRMDNTLSIELIDTPENIFARMVFSDPEDKVYRDEEYKDRHRDHYLHEIQMDLNWYGRVYSFIPHKFDLGGKDPETAAVEIIERFGLNWIDRKDKVKP